MAHHKSAIKRIRSTEKRRIRNKSYKNMMKSSIKKVRTAPDKDAAIAELKNAYSVIDKLAEKGIIQRNTAANKKSRLTNYVNSLT